MKISTIIESSLRQVEQVLEDVPGSEDGGFVTRVERTCRYLPDELVTELRELLRCHEALQSGTDESSERAGEFCFRCGSFLASFRSYRLLQLEMESAILSENAVAANPLQAAQSDRLERFIEARDRVFRKVADVTLKFLLFAFGFLLLGLLVGVV